MEAAKERLKQMRTQQKEWAGNNKMRLKKTRKMVFTVVVFFSIGQSVAMGNFPTVPIEVYPPPLEYETATSSRIVRAKVEKKEVQRYGGNLTIPPCGYRYQLNILEVFKGKYDRLTVFSTESELNVGGEYLMFIHESPKIWKRYFDDVGSLLTTNEHINLICRVEAADYILPSNRKTYFELDSNANHIFGGTWLNLDGTSESRAFMWCSSYWGVSSDPVPSSNLLNVRRIKYGETYVSFLELESAKKLIRRAINNPPDIFGFIPNVLFKPGGC